MHQGIDKEGDQIRDEIFSENHNFTFDQITNLNLGNPQRGGASTFISFNRDVISAIMNPRLLKANVFSQDVVNRSEELLAHMGSPIGAYTSDSRGYKFSRQKIADFIEQRDGVEADPDKIYLTNGASEAAKLAISFLIRDENDGLLLPTPNYPLYGAKLSLQGGTAIAYPLTEGENWTIDPERVERRILKAQKDGLNVRAMVVVNPGNPTGHVLARENIEQVIELCYKHSVLIVADEVYQDNIHTKRKPFVSFRQVLNRMEPAIRNSVELLSLDSVSKGMSGESGLRGGFIETHNIDDEIERLMYKLRSMNLCSNTVGQIAVTLYVDRPREGRESEATVQKFREQLFKIRDGYRQRASIIHNVLEEMEGVSCTPFEGSMYTFPRLHLPQRAVDRAAEKGMAADYYYSLKLLRETGIQVVPGQGFGQEEGSHHIRISNLFPSLDKLDESMQKLRAFNSAFHKRYQ